MDDKMTEVVLMARRYCLWKKVLKTCPAQMTRSRKCEMIKHNFDDFVKVKSSNRDILEEGDCRTEAVTILPKNWFISLLNSNLHELCGKSRIFPFFKNFRSSLSAGNCETSTDVTWRISDNRSLRLRPNYAIFIQLIACDTSRALKKYFRAIRMQFFNVEHEHDMSHQINKNLQRGIIDYERIIIVIDVSDLHKILVM